MTLKSGAWIRRMAEESEFIQTLDAALVRAADGRSIVNARASSYGHDMRLATFETFKLARVRRRHRYKHAILSVLIFGLIFLASIPVLIS